MCKYIVYIYILRSGVFFCKPQLSLNPDLVGVDTIQKRNARTSNKKQETRSQRQSGEQISRKREARNLKRDLNHKRQGTGNYHDCSCSTISRKTLPGQSVVNKIWTGRHRITLRVFPY